MKEGDFDFDKSNKLGTEKVIFLWLLKVFFRRNLNNLRVYLNALSLLFSYNV